LLFWGNGKYRFQQYANTDYSVFSLIFRRWITFTSYFLPISCLLPKKAENSYGHAPLKAV